MSVCHNKQSLTSYRSSEPLFRSPWLLCCSSDAGITDDADRVAGSQTRQTNRQTGAKVDKAPGIKIVNRKRGGR